MASAPSIDAMGPLRLYIREQIDELVGDQIRAATQDGIRLGFSFSADMAGKFVETYENIHPDAVAVLEAFRAILVGESLQIVNGPYAVPEVFAPVSLGVDRSAPWVVLDTGLNWAVG